MAPLTATTPSSRIEPSVTVPVLSSSTVSTDRAASNTSPPLHNTPNSAARPVPAMIAAGVASPSAQGHAIKRTAVACNNASPGDAPARTIHPRNVAAARPSTMGTKTAEIRSANRWAGAFEPWAACNSRTISESFVCAPTFVMNTTSRP